MTQGKNLPHFQSDFQIFMATPATKRPQPILPWLPRTRKDACLPEPQRVWLSTVATWSFSYVANRALSLSLASVHPGQQTDRKKLNQNTSRIRVITHHSPWSPQKLPAISSKLFSCLLFSPLVPPLWQAHATQDLPSWHLSTDHCDGKMMVWTVNHRQDKHIFQANMECI